MRTSRRGPRSSSRIRLSPDQVKAYVERHPEANTPDLAAALAELGLPTRLSASPRNAPRARRGVDVAPIVRSLKSATSRAAAGVSGPASLSLWFSGARVLTVNELFSIFQFRMYEAFRYKKCWRDLVSKAVRSLPATDRKRLWFDGPTRLTLYRRALGPIDLDSLATVFKYATDTLRAEGIIDDDNPEIIVDIQLRQIKGSSSPALGLRLDALPDWTPPPSERTFEEWFGQEEPCLAKTSFEDRELSCRRPRAPARRPLKAGAIKPKTSKPKTSKPKTGTR